MAIPGILMQVSNGSASVSVATNQILDSSGAGQINVMIGVLVTLIRLVEAPMPHGSFFWDPPIEVALEVGGIHQRDALRVVVMHVK